MGAIEKPTIYLVPNPEGFEPKWVAWINGELTDVTEVVLYNPLFGFVAYGNAKGLGFPFDCVMFRENSGGGPVLLPYTIIDGSLYVGVAIQKRHTYLDENNQPRSVISAVGGFSTGNDDIKTLIEEACLEFVYIKGKIIKLPGLRSNSNRGLLLKLGKDDGNGFYATYVDPDDIEETDLGQKRVKGFVVRNTPFEKLEAAVFISVSEAITSEDGILIAGVARLLNWLAQEGKIDLSVK